MSIFFTHTYQNVFPLTPLLHRTMKRVCYHPGVDEVFFAEEQSKPASAQLGGKEGCWVFTNQAKAGGTTINHILKQWTADQGLPKPGLFDNWWYAKGVKTMKEFDLASHDITTGEYAEALRPYSTGDKCQWFTVFRHPVARLVSAYFYCKHSAWDPICTTNVYRDGEIDLLTFAELWSNYGLRTFAAGYVLPTQVFQSNAAKQCRKCPVWYKLKGYLEELRQSDSKFVDETMVQFLAPAQELLRTQYKAVGILENFNSTMHLFNRALEMPGMDWPAAFVRQGVANKDKASAAEEHAALELARTDSSIKQFLLLDLLLYEQAVDVHKQQLADHDLA